MPVTGDRTGARVGILAALLVAVVAVAVVTGCGGKGKNSAAVPPTPTGEVRGQAIASPAESATATMPVSEVSGVKAEATLSQGIAPEESTAVQAALETQIKRSTEPPPNRGRELDTRVQDSVEVIIRDADGNIKKRIKE